MALSVTPTSGVAPYLLSATFDNSVAFGHGYELIVRKSGSMGTCNTDITTGPLDPTIAAALLSTGQYQITNTVAGGRCDVYKVYVRDIANNVIITPMTAQINNL